MDLNGLACLRRIEGEAFSECDSLESISLVNLPLLGSIGDYASFECARLTSVGALWPSCPFALSGQSALPRMLFSALRCSVGSPDASSALMTTPFFRCRRLSDLDFSALPSLRTIGKCAVQECDSLESVALANRPLLESIGEFAFNGCTRISTLDLSDLPSLRSIGKRAFSDCVSLRCVRLANLPLLNGIGESVFSGCGSLSSVDLCGLGAVSIIDKCAFSACTSLQSIPLSNMPLLASIGDYAFFCGVRVLIVWTFPACPSLRCVGEGAF